MDVLCKKCHHEYTIELCTQQVELFVITSCPNCYTKCNQCLLCEKRYFASKHNDYRNIRNHIAQCHQDSQSISLGTTAGGSDQPQSDKSNDLDGSLDDTNFDIQDSCRDLEDEEIDGIVN